MATSYTSLLGLALPATGELSGTWGDTVNNYISTYLDSSIAGALTLTADTTLTKTTGSSLGATSSQYAIIIASPASAAITITAPAASKIYVVNNTSGTYSVTFKASGQTGVVLAINEKAVLAFNGTDFVKIGSSGTVSSVTASGNIASSGGTTPNITFTGTLPVGSGGTGATTLAGANIPVTNVANTFSATQTFSGTSSTFGTSLLDSNETVNVVAAAPSSTTNFYVQSGSVQYYTSNAANNWTLNIAFSSGTSMNSALAVGQSVTFALVTTQSTTAYYNSAVTIDGTPVTPKWISGAPTAGNASGLDVYRFSVIKTASATYTVLASLTQYK